MARRFPFVFIFLATALCICSAYYFSFPWDVRSDTQADYLDSLAVFRVHVQEPPTRKSNGWMLAVNLPAHGQQAMLFVRDDSVSTLQPAMGDILLVRTRITRPQALFKGDFDYGNYLRLQHKVGVGYTRASQCRCIGHLPVRTLRARAAAIQQLLVERYADAGLSGRALAFVAAITLGEKDELDSSLRRSFAAAGAAHVLAVSGLHTGFIYALIVALFTLFGTRRPLYEQRTQRIILSVIILLVMWLYAFVTGLTPSVTRAVLMLTIAQVGWVARRQPVSLNTLAAAACICLWIDPLSLFSVSFQLSFSAVLGILLFLPYLNSLWLVHNKVQRIFRDTITVTIAATIGTLPVTLYYFGQAARYTIAVNILVIPAAFSVVSLGLLVLLLAKTPIATGLVFVLQWISEHTCRYVQWIEHLRGATLQLSVTPWMVVCLIAGIAFFYFYLHYRHTAWLMPSIAAIALFCTLHVVDVRSQEQTQAIALRGRTLYYKHGMDTTAYPLTARYNFFRFSHTDYVYAPYLSTYRQQQLQRYCNTHNITYFQSFEQ